MSSDGLVMKCFNLIKGQVVTLDDNFGLQVGQRLSEGLNESYPIDGATLNNEGVNYKIYAKLPKLLFKANVDELKGISLIINGKQNKVIDKTISECKISKELKTSGYLIDLKEYISLEGLYRIALDYPKMHKQLEVGTFAFINDFDYEFLGAPYIFKEYGKIQFKKIVRIDRNTKENDGTWTSDTLGNTFEFNFGERNENSDNYCRLVEGNELVLSCAVGSSNYPVRFEIPALYWKFSADDVWNTNRPANISLKDFKNKVKKLYVSGPFNFAKSTILTTDDVDIAEEESEIKLISGKNKYFEIEKVYDWFKNNRSESYRKLFITLDDKKVDLFNVICKSRLRNVSMVGDFENNLLIGSLSIEGHETYTISIYHNGIAICEDEQVIDNQFCLETELESGDYYIYVYEIKESEEDDDGFDAGTETILINENSKPIVKKLINLNDLEGQMIILRGYQDINKKYMTHLFDELYVIIGLEKTNYTQFFQEESESEIYGIWNEKIDYENAKEMNQYAMYKGRLGFYRRSDGSFQQLMKVIVFYPDKMRPESILILAKDADEIDFSSLTIDRSKERIIPGFQYKRMARIERKKCDCFYDDQYFYLTEIVEE